MDCNLQSLTVYSALLTVSYSGSQAGHLARGQREGHLRPGLRPDACSDRSSLINLYVNPNHGGGGLSLALRCPVAEGLPSPASAAVRIAAEAAGAGAESPPDSGVGAAAGAAASAMRSGPAAGGGLCPVARVARHVTPRHTLPYDEDCELQ